MVKNIFSIAAFTIIYLVGSQFVYAQTKQSQGGLLTETKPAKIEAPVSADAEKVKSEKPESKFDKTDEEIAQEESSKVQRNSEPKEDAAKESEKVTQDAAKEETKTEEVKEQTASKNEKKDEEKRRHVLVMADAAILTTWVPMKFGGRGGYYFTNDLALEVGYLNGKIDLEDIGFDGVGDVKEKRLDILARYYLSKKFSVFAGYSMQETELKVSSKLLDENPGVAALPFDTTSIDTKGFIAGITSRWHWDMGLTIGVDWLSVFLPMSSSVENDLRKELAAFSSTEDYKNIEDGYEKIEDLPRVTLFQLGLGFTF